MNKQFFCIIALISSSSWSMASGNNNDYKITLNWIMYPQLISARQQYIELEKQYETKIAECKRIEATLQEKITQGESITYNTEIYRAYKIADLAMTDARNACLSENDACSQRESKSEISKLYQHLNTINDLSRTILQIYETEKNKNLDASSDTSRYAFAIWESTIKTHLQKK